MGTVNIATAGFSPYPASPPSGWPINVAWPPTGSPVFNNAHQATITDAELIQMITWVAATQLARQGPVLITTPQLHNLWVQSIFTNIKLGIQGFFTTPGVIPPPINLS